MTGMSSEAIDPTHAQQQAGDGQLAMLKGNRKVVADFYFASNVTNEPDKYAFNVYVRLNAKKLKFEKVSFQHCIFDTCYLNNCVFDSCDFTGCRFIGCNLHNTVFAGCKFDYATFERTQIDDAILESEAPPQENLAMRFARSLRMNYTQIGDARAVNKAISIELRATATYLYKSWKSRETYYQTKYSGLKAVPQFLKWVEFWILDFVWGNGESILKLARTIGAVFVAIALYDALAYGDSSRIDTYTSSLLRAPGIFFGVTSTPYASWVLALIAASRFISVALLTALLVKRFGRR